MKKIAKVLIFLFAVLIIFEVVILVLLNSKESELYKKYKSPSEKAYGKKLYSEIDYICTDEEWQIGEEITQGVRKSVIEGNKDNEMKYKKVLEDYLEPEVKITSFKTRLITCKLNGDVGHVWVEISIEAQDENGNRQSRENSLEMWTIEKSNGEWCVTERLCAP